MPDIEDEKRPPHLPYPLAAQTATAAQTDRRPWRETAIFDYRRAPGCVECSEDHHWTTTGTMALLEKASLKRMTN